MQAAHFDLKSRALHRHEIHEVRAGEHGFKKCGVVFVELIIFIEAGGNSFRTRSFIDWKSTWYFNWCFKNWSREGRRRKLLLPPWTTNPFGARMRLSQLGHETLLLGFFELRDVYEVS